MKRWAIALGAVLALSAASNAHAFCLTRGCDELDARFECGQSPECVESGQVLHWSSSCVSYGIQKDGSELRGFTADELADVVERAFDEWLSADCSGGKPSLRVSETERIDCRTPEYNQDGGNSNTFMFRDRDWPYVNTPDTIALTTLIYNTKNGEIFDADVEINSHERPDLKLGNIGPTDVDLDSVLTHEVGHFLGLSHSGVPGTTMFESYTDGNIDMATIEEDDIAGICAALPPGRETASSSCEPRHGFSGECGGGDEGCQFTPARAPSPGPLTALAALVGLLVVRRRRRQ